MSPDPLPRDRSPLSRIAPAVGLFVLAPLCGEFLIGNVLARELPALPVLAAMYGGGAVAIREVARRTGRGWPTILLLGAAYGVVEAGIVDRSLFNPVEVGGVRDTSVGWIPVLGLNVPNLLAYGTGHAVGSIAVPTMLIEALVSARRRTTPWLGGTGLAIAALLYLVGCRSVVQWAVSEGFSLRPGQVIVTIIIALGLIAAAFAVGRRPWPTVAAPAPRPLRVGTWIFIPATASLLVPEGWASAAVNLVLLVVLFGLLVRWSRRERWSDRHRLAAAGAMLLRSAMIGMLFTAALRQDTLPIDVIGSVVLALGAVALLALATRSVRRSGDAPAPERRPHLPMTFADWNPRHRPLSLPPVRRNIRSGNPYEDVYGYCRAVRVGSTIHVSGTTAQAPNVEGHDAYEQAVAALDIIGRALDEAGSSHADVVRTVTYVTDIGDAELVARAHVEVYGDVRPAATLVEVSALIDPALKVEIEAYAVAGD